MRSTEGLRGPGGLGTFQVFGSWLAGPEEGPSSDGTWRSPVAHLSRAARNGRGFSYPLIRETSEDRGAPTRNAWVGDRSSMGFSGQSALDPLNEVDRLSSDGTWRSPVAHLNGVQGVAGSNPAVPIRLGPHRRGSGGGVSSCSTAGSVRGARPVLGDPATFPVQRHPAVPIRKASGGICLRWPFMLKRRDRCAGPGLFSKILPPSPCSDIPPSRWVRSEKPGPAEGIARPGFSASGLPGGGAGARGSVRAMRRGGVRRTAISGQRLEPVAPLARMEGEWVSSRE